MADADKKEVILFDDDKHFILRTTEEVNGNSIDSLVIEEDGEVDTIITIKKEGIGKKLHFHGYFVGNGLPAKSKAMKYYDEIKGRYSN